MKLIDGDRLIEKLEAFAALSQFGEDEMVEIGRIIAFVRDEPDVKERWTLTIPASSILTNDVEYDILGKRPTKLSDESCVQVEPFTGTPTAEQMEWKFDDENN